MTRLVAAAAACMAVGVVLLLLAVDVRGWRSAIEGGDAVYAAAPARASWTPETRLGGVSRSLLSTGDDVEARRALQLYRRAAATHLRLDNATEVQTARAAAQDALLSVASSGDARRASQARTLLGILTFGRSASGGDEDQLANAVADFTDAVRADAANDGAKFDLELLLRSSAASGTRPGQGVGGGFGRGGRRGAGGGTPGKGY